MRAFFARLLLALRRLSHEPLIRLAWFAGCALWLCWPLFATAHELNEFRDAQVLFSYEDVAVRSVRKFGEWPLWDPYYCGGLYGLGTPQSRFAAPTFLLSLMFGPLVAQPLIAFALSILGMEGMFRYARTRTASALGPALIAPLFAGNGFLVTSYFNGWLNFYGFLLLPWVFYGIDRCARRAKDGALILGASAAFIVGFGGTYAAPMAALLAVPLLLRSLAARVRSRAHLLGSLRCLSLAVWIALAMCAFRVWPVLESLIAAPRIMAGAPKEPLPQLMHMLFEIAAPRGFNMSVDGQMFVGLTLLPLAALGALRVRGVFPLLLGGLCVWAATGYQHEYSLFAWLRELPVVSTLRYPQRFLFPAALFACEAAALGADLSVRCARRRPWLSIPSLLVIASLTAMTLKLQGDNARAVVAGMWLGPAPLEIDQPFKQARGNRWIAAHYAPISRGSLSCWEAYPVPMSKLLRSDLKQEEYLVDQSAGSVTRRRFSPNQLTLAVTLQKPARLRINQNYHPGWKASIGQVVSDQGLLAVDLPAGRHELVLSFRPRSAVYGALISLLGLFAALSLVWQRQRLSLGLSAAVPFVFVASFVLSDEPLPKAPPMRNADESPLLVERMPPGAHELGVEFDDVLLAGASGPSTDEAGHQRFVLYFRVLGPVPRSVGISVHFASNRGRFRTADHDVVGASVFFSDAPRNVLLADAFTVDLDPEPGEHWKMYVSLWHVGGDGSRVEAYSRAPVEILDNRVLALEF